MNNNTNIFISPYTLVGDSFDPAKICIDPNCKEDPKRVLYNRNYPGKHCHLRDCHCDKPYKTPDGLSSIWMRIYSIENDAGYCLRCLVVSIMEANKYFYIRKYDLEHRTIYKVYYFKLDRQTMEYVVNIDNLAYHQERKNDPVYVEISSKTQWGVYLLEALIGEGYFLRNNNLLYLSD